jgi:hypothetical protein
MQAVANCDELKDRLMLMQANVLDETDGRHVELDHTEKECKSLKANLQEQIQATTLRLEEHQQMLAEVTTSLIQASEQSRLKSNQWDQLQSDIHKLEATCKDVVDQAALQICKVRTVRSELYGIANGYTTLQDKQMPIFIQDCEVSQWTPKECSKPCGGGMQNLVRVVVVPPENGAGCPPLVMQQSCSVHKCPVDCEMGEWSGWTSCSSKCGGGIKQRIRTVTRRAQHGGKLCGPESQSMECGMEPCDQNCRLSQWSEWGNCSKACGGGFHMRTRYATNFAKGLGMCPEEDSPLRLQYKSCTNAACNSTQLKCASKVDVVFLLDVSGSIGSDGLTAIRKAGSDLVKAMDAQDGAQVAVLAIRGHRTWTNSESAQVMEGQQLT